MYNIDAAIFLPDIITLGEHLTNIVKIKRVHFFMVHSVDYPCTSQSRRYVSTVLLLFCVSYFLRNFRNFLVKSVSFYIEWLAQIAISVARHQHTLWHHGCGACT